MKRAYWIMIILMQTQCIYGMRRQRELTPDCAAFPERGKRRKYAAEDDQHSRQSSQSSAMEISNTGRDENDSLTSVSYSDEDLRDITASIEACRLGQIQDEKRMTQEEQDEFYRLAIIRAIADDSEAEDAGMPLGHDKDW